MPTRPTAICPHCSSRSLPGSARCQSHEAQHQAHRNARRTHYLGDWERISREARAEWLATVGPWCPGIDRPGHTVDPATLQLDHTTGKVLCNRCNVAAGPARIKMQPDGEGGSK